MTKLSQCGETVRPSFTLQLHVPPYRQQPAVISFLSQPKFSGGLC